MRRTQKMALFLVLAVLSFVLAVAVTYEIVAPRIAKGMLSPPPVTGIGWVQLVFSGSAMAGFGLAGIWQGVLMFIEARLPAAIHQVPSPQAGKTGTAVVDVTKLTAFLVLIRQVTDDGTKLKLTEAARMACDSLRDDLFPFPDPGKA